MRSLPLILILISLVLFAGCRRRGGELADKDYDRALRPGERALVEVPPEDWPDFTLVQSNRGGLREAIGHSLNYLGKASARAKYPVGDVSHAAVVEGLQRFLALLDQNLDGHALQERLRSDFRLLRSVGWDGRGTVLFTGYYTPIFDASLTPTAEFRYPLYKRPADFVPVDLHNSLQRRPDGSTQPYPDRAALHRSGALQGLELAYLREPFDPYIIQVQGSAKLRLNNGRTMEIGMHGTTGHQYVGIAHRMIEDGVMRKEDLNLQTMRRYFREQPHMVEHYVMQNPRFVFFTERDGGPYGSLNEPVTRDVSIATDKSIFPAGALCFVDTTLGWGAGAQHYVGFRLDQDTGGAIQAPGRCDLYMGEGELAERRAGMQRHEGFLYYLVAR